MYKYIAKKLKLQITSSIETFDIFIKSSQLLLAPSRSKLTLSVNILRLEALSFNNELTQIQDNFSTVY